MIKLCNIHERSTETGSSECAFLWMSLEPQDRKELNDTVLKALEELNTIVENQYCTAIRFKNGVAFHNAKELKEAKEWTNPIRGKTPKVAFVYLP